LLFPYSRAFDCILSCFVPFLLLHVNHQTSNKSMPWRSYFFCFLRTPNSCYASCYALRGWCSHRRWKVVHWQYEPRWLPPQMKKRTEAGRHTLEVLVWSYGCLLMNVFGNFIVREKLILTHLKQGLCVSCLRLLRQSTKNQVA
jgi:hypothetical protein